MAAELADSMRADVLGALTVSAAPGSTGRRSRDEVLAQLEADARGTATGALIPLAAEAILVDIDAAHAAAEVTDVPEVRVPLATIRGRDDSLVSDEQARRWEGLARAGWCTGTWPATTSSSSGPPGSCSVPCGGRWPSSPVSRESGCRPGAWW